MDEQSFDKLIKEKLDSYRDPGFDENAFGTLSERLSVQTPTASYKKYIGPASVVAVALLTIFNFSITFNHNTDHDHDIALHRTIDSLQLIIDKKSTAEKKESPVQQSTSVKTFQTKEINLQHKEPKPQTTETRNIVAVPSLQESEAQHIEIVSSPSRSHLSEINIPVVAPTVRYIFVKVHEPLNNKASHKTSLAVVKKLEQHYFHGLGINLAPTAGVGALRYNDAPASLLPSAGISADWILSPRFSIETNASFAFGKHMVGMDEPEVQKFNNTSYGDLRDVMRTDNLLKTTAFFKYRQWLNERDQVILKLGWSRYTSFGGKYTMTYSRDLYYDPDDHKGVTQIERFERIRTFANMPSVGVGFSRQLNRTQKIEVSAFYEPGLSFNKCRMQVFGVQSAFWFKVR